MGKSALLDDLAASATDLRLARLDGVQSEMALPFAALHQILRPHLAGLDGLPPPQRDALRLAFGLQQGEPPDRFLIGLATLGLLAGHAGGQPLLCLVDDAHWLDLESGAALAFVARRLFADSVAMVFATREPALLDGVLDGLPTLHVDGLADPDAVALLAATAGPGLGGTVRDQVVAAAGGNPLALIEIGQGLGPGQLTGAEPLPDPLPLGDRLARRYLGEVRDLPSATQTFLLTAAADPTGDPALLWQAGTHLGFTPDAAAEAEARHLVRVRDTVRFRHPLIRSAVYHGAALALRQRVHAGLAAATDPVTEPDRHAWHRAEAASAPDESVATELEQAARRARHRGGWTAASALFARAAALSPDRTARARRFLDAADASCGANSPERAQVLLDAVTDPAYRGSVQRVRGRVLHMLRRPAEATSALLASAAELATVDVRRARDVLVEAAVQAQINGSLATTGTSRADVALAARKLPPTEPATPGDALLDADTTLVLDGLTAAAPRLRHAITAVRQESADAPELLQWLAAACADATILADDDALHDLVWRMEPAARDRGAVAPLALALSHAGVSELLAGRLAEAERCFVERAAIEEARGHPQHIGALLVAAWRGQVDRTRSLLAVVADEAARQGQGYQLGYAGYARCVLELGLGRYQEAFDSIDEDIDDTSHLKFALPDLVEAAQRAGETEAARDLVARLAGLAEASPVPRTLGFLARARALVATDPTEAEGYYREAAEHHDRARGRVHLARTRLVHGEWLRRVRRPLDAREQLRAAHEVFEDMGAAGFATRAREELAAAGEKVRARTPATHGHGLTAQELRVARLAAGGATNAQIAAQLYLSANTVDYHLRKVFRKLDVTSRHQLADADLS